MQDSQMIDEETAYRGGMVEGRQVVHLILVPLRIVRHIDQMWQIEDLSNSEYPGDNVMGPSATCDTLFFVSQR